MPIRSRLLRVVACPRHLEQSFGNHAQTGPWGRRWSIYPRVPDPKLVNATIEA